MAERCNLCGYHGGQHSDECFAIRSQLRASEAECERLEAMFQQTHGCHHSWVAKAQEAEKLKSVVEAQARVIEAADWIRDEQMANTSRASSILRYDAAKAELERVKGE